MNNVIEISKLMTSEIHIEPVSQPSSARVLNFADWTRRPFDSVRQHDGRRLAVLRSLGLLPDNYRLVREPAQPHASAVMMTHGTSDVDISRRSRFFADSPLTMVGK